MESITGIHHVTAIAGDAQANLQFYTGVLGLRLVKRTVNQDVPDTYHLFYADAEGHPGADLTFFSWPDMPPARPGVGLAMEVALAVPAGSLEYWAQRLAGKGITTGKLVVRGSQQTLPLSDPDGLSLVLVETAEPREFSPWNHSPIPETRQIRGLHAVRLWEDSLASTARFLAEALGFRSAGASDGWHRFEVGDGGSGRHLEIKETPGLRRGEWGRGGVHHVAWRVPDEVTQAAVRGQVRAARGHPTEVIDRFWFKSVYFLEPGGTLFEIATDGPGFAVDEDPGSLGEHLVLPPWLEGSRKEIEAALPPLVTRVGA
jgi:glyoxalase family protein